MNESDHRVSANPLPPVQARPIVEPPVASDLRPPVRSAEPLHLEMIARRFAWADLLLVLLVAVVPYGLQFLAALLAGGERATAEGGSILIFAKWFELATAAGLLAYLVVRNGTAVRAYGLHFRGLPKQLLWAAAAVVLIYVYMACSLVVIGLVVQLFPSLLEDLMRRTQVIDVLPIGNIVMTVVLLVPVALHEEIVFRGLLVTYLRRLTSRWWIAILLSSALFGLLHLPQGVLGAIQISGIGAILAITFVVSRSLLAVSLAHFAFDFLQFQLIRLVPNLQQTLENLQNSPS